MGGKKQRKSITPVSTTPAPAAQPAQAAEEKPVEQPKAAEAKKTEAPADTQEAELRAEAARDELAARIAQAEALKKVEASIPVAAPPSHVANADKAPDPVEEIRSNLKALVAPIATAQASLGAVDPRTAVGRANLVKLGKVIANGEIKLGRITLPPRETRVISVPAPQACWLSRAKLLTTPATGKFSVLGVGVGTASGGVDLHISTHAKEIIFVDGDFVRRGAIITVRLRNDTTNPIVIEAIAEADYLVDDELWLDLVDKGTALAPLAAVLEKI